MEPLILVAPIGGALTGPSRRPRETIVSDLLAIHGAPLGTAGLRVTSLARAGKTGVTHVRFDQEIDGVRVHGAYVKAAFTDAGRMLHLAARVAPGPTGFRAGVRGVSAAQALTSALHHLGHAESEPMLPHVVLGKRTVFARGAELEREPTVERVAFIDDAGDLRTGFLVETWFRVNNQLDHTIVDDTGAVIAVEHRTNQDSYNVFVEDPLKGAQTVVSGPGAGNAESPAGWLGAGSQTTIDIGGNNARAYLDADANNAPDVGGSAVTDGTFLAAVDLTQQPSTANNRAVAVQNLFYLNNVIHDVLYRHGFTEAAGNFQADNFGLAGLGNDPVRAEAQDGGGTNNANFATPSDGSPPRMQMYLWSGAGPDSIVTVGGDDYGAWQSTFGPALTTAGIGAATALYADSSGVTTDGCETSTVSLAGRIALIDRGTCNFTVKVLNAQRAGAVGVIIMNNLGTNDGFGPGGVERRIRIPSVMVSLESGQALRAQVGADASMRKSGVEPLMIDGDLDADIVFHEYGHGLTWRMVGGMSGPIAGAVGEGASDVLAFLVNGDDRIGEYSFSNPLGIRRQPYSTYVGTYANVDGAEVHNDGEIYAATMWDVRSAYLDAGFTVEDVLADFVGGMSYTPPTPAFEHMRDGMLQTAAGTGRECLIWRAFAARGVGVGASAIVRGKRVTITESFALPSSCP